MRMVSIDWDFFVPENPLWDMSHAESKLYLDILWAHRLGLMNEMKTDGNEKTFWKWLHQDGCGESAMAYVSESHAYAIHLAKHVDEIVLFDAHHDCWPSKEGDKEGAIYCDNWLRVWLEQDRSRKLTWVRPEHALCTLRDGAEDFYDDKGKLSGQISVGVYSPEDAKPEDYDILHICRSGCWTPPWLDKQFTEFVLKCGALDPENLQDDEDWNCMEERWTPEMQEEYIKQHNRVQEFMVNTQSRVTA